MAAHTLRSMSDILERYQHDLALLADLLAFLPDPDDEDETEWWEKFAALEQEARYPGRSD
jgi:hypothetical protein